MESIRHKIAICLHMFHKLSARLHDYPVQVTVAVKNELARFRVWIANAGALRQDRESLEDLLRGSEERHKAILVLVQQLTDCVEQCLDLERHNDLELHEEIPGSYTHVMQDTSVELPDGNMQRTDRSTGMEMILNLAMPEIKDILQNLSRLTRVYLDHPHAIDSVENEPSLQLVNDYDRYLHRLRSIEISAGEPLSFLTTPSFRDGDALHTGITTWLGKRLAKAEGLRKSYLKLHQRQQISRSPSVKRIVEAYMAGLLPRQNYVNEREDSWVPDELLAMLPTVPYDLRLQTTFCPYCGIEYDGSNLVLEDSPCRLHVLQDLKPYICTYEQCSEPFTIFADKVTWLEHEQEAHRSVFECRYCENESFTTKEQLRQHLLHHDFPNGNAHVDLLIDLTPAKHQDNREVCPFCHGEGPWETNLDDHIALHQVAIVLISNDWRVVLDSEDLDLLTTANTFPHGRFLSAALPASSSGHQFQSAPLVNISHGSSLWGNAPPETVRSESWASTNYGVSKLIWVCCHCGDFVGSVVNDCCPVCGHLLCTSCGIDNVAC